MRSNGGGRKGRRRSDEGHNQAHEEEEGTKEDMEINIKRESKGNPRGLQPQQQGNSSTSRGRFRILPLLLLLLLTIALLIMIRSLGTFGSVGATVGSLREYLFSPAVASPNVLPGDELSESEGPLSGSNVRGILYKEAELRRAYLLEQRREEREAIAKRHQMIVGDGGGDPEVIAEDSEGRHGTTKPILPTSASLLKRSNANRGVALRGLVIRDAATPFPASATTAKLSEEENEERSGAEEEKGTIEEVEVEAEEEEEPFLMAGSWPPLHGSNNSKWQYVLRRRNGVRERKSSEMSEDIGRDDGIGGRGADPLERIFSRCALDAPHLSLSSSSTLSRQCDPSRCRFCKHFPPHGSPAKIDYEKENHDDTEEDLLPETKSYLSQHVLFAVVTGNFGNFSRLDLAYCTWLQLVPEENLYVITDTLPADGTVPSAPHHRNRRAKKGRRRIRGKGGDDDEKGGKEEYPHDISLSDHTHRHDSNGRHEEHESHSANSDESYQGGSDEIGKDGKEKEKEYSRGGHWLEGAIPRGHTFTQRQLEATKGYTISWHMAQYRFMLGLDAMVRRAAVEEASDAGDGNADRASSTSRRAEGEEKGIKGLKWAYASSTRAKNAGSIAEERDYVFPSAQGRRAATDRKKKRSAAEYIKWIAVVDDDTFVNLNALVVFFKRMDANTLRIDRERRQMLQARGKVREDNTNKNLTEYGDGEVLPLEESTPVYIGDNGWGGAGHFFNRAAAKRLQEHLYFKCVKPHMMLGGKASDEALKKCLPHLNSNTGNNALSRPLTPKEEDKGEVLLKGGENGIGNSGGALVVASPPRMRVVNDRLFSHCQANFLRKRLLRGDHITSHIKRDVTGPIALQALRARLYYQVTYMRNTSCAYELLMHFGACAYGSSCRLRVCDEKHDRRSIEDYQRLLVTFPLDPSSADSGASTGVVNDLADEAGQIGESHNRLGNFGNDALDPYPYGYGRQDEPQPLLVDTI